MAKLSTPAEVGLVLTVVAVGAALIKIFSKDETCPTCDSVIKLVGVARALCPQCGIIPLAV